MLWNESKKMSLKRILLVCLNVCLFMYSVNIFNAIMALKIFLMRKHKERRQFLFNDKFIIFYLQLYGVGHFIE